MVIELRVVQFWSEIILVISNQTCAARSFDFEITCMISDQIALHLVQLPLLIPFTDFATNVKFFLFHSMRQNNLGKRKSRVPFMLNKKYHLESKSPGMVVTFFSDEFVSVESFFMQPVFHEMQIQS